MKNLLVIISMLLLTSCATKNGSINSMIERDNNIIEDKIDDYSIINNEVDSRIKESKKTFLSEKRNFQESLKSYLVTIAEINAILYSGLSPEEDYIYDVKKLIKDGGVKKLELENIVENMKLILTGLDENNLYFDYVDNSISHVKSSQSISVYNSNLIKESENKLRKLKASNFMFSVKMKRDIVRYISLLEKEKILYDKLNARISKGGHYELPRHEIKTEVVVFKNAKLENKNEKKILKPNKVVISTDEVLITEVKSFSSKKKNHRKKVFQPMNDTIKSDTETIFKIKVISSSSSKSMEDAIELISMLSKMGLNPDRILIQTEVRNNTSPVLEIYKDMKSMDSTVKMARDNKDDNIYNIF